MCLTHVKAGQESSMRNKKKEGKGSFSWKKKEKKETPVPRLKNTYSKALSSAIPSEMSASKNFENYIKKTSRSC